MRWSTGVIAVGLLSGLFGCDRSPTQSAQAAVTAPQTSSAPTQSVNSNLPILLVDARHSIHQSDGTGTPYLIKAGPGIILDGKQFSFSDPQHEGRQANVVRVIYEGCEYSAPWPQKGTPRSVLDIQTMEVVKGSAAFTGFEKGHRAAVGIGFESPDATSGRTEFREFWAAWVIFD